jgi:pimeloyl-ACP methyl ester carboxylesterase
MIPPRAAGHTGAMAIAIDGAGEPVVLAGGGPGNTSQAHYFPWFEALAERFQVVRFGYEAPHTIEGYADQIDAVREELGTDRVSVIGLSFGGMPAIAYALRHPERLHRLVLSNAQISARTWQEGNIDAVNAGLRKHFPERWARLLELRERGVRSLDDEIQGMYGELLERLEWADPAKRPRQRHEPPDVGVYATVAGDDPEWEVGGTMAGFDPDLSAITAPTLVVSGRWDGLTSPRIAREAADQLGAELVVLERSAHRPWCEEPERYFAVVGDFLSAARPAR